MAVAKKKPSKNKAAAAKKAAAKKAAAAKKKALAQKKAEAKRKAVAKKKAAAAKKKAALAKKKAALAQKKAAAAAKKKALAAKKKAAAEKKRAAAAKKKAAAAAKKAAAVAKKKAAADKKRAAAEKKKAAAAKKKAAGANKKAAGANKKPSAPKKPAVAPAVTAVSDTMETEPVRMRPPMFDEGGGDQGPPMMDDDMGDAEDSNGESLWAMDSDDDDDGGAGDEDADDLSDSLWGQVSSRQNTWPVTQGREAEGSWRNDRERDEDEDEDEAEPTRVFGSDRDGEEDVDDSWGVADEGATTRLTQTVHLEAAPEDVYDAYMDTERHTEFTGKPAEIERCVGGQMHAHGGYITGEFIELEEGYRIVQTWRTNMWPDDFEDSQLTLTFEPTDDGHTKITMVHEQVPAEQAIAYREGWDEYYWEPLRRYFS